MRKQELKMKDIDLLQLYYQKSSGETKRAAWINYVIPLVAVALLFVGIFGFIEFRNYRIQNEIEETNAELSKLQTEILDNPDALEYTKIQEVLEKADFYQGLYAKIASYPTLQSGTFDAIANSAYGNIQVTSLAYVRESQIITLQIETSNVEGSETFVRRLKATGVFLDVTYRGYNQTKKNTATNETETKSAEDQILEYLAKQNQSKTNSQEDNTYDVYTSTVLCTLK